MWKAHKNYCNVQLKPVLRGHLKQHLDQHSYFKKLDVKEPNNQCESGKHRKGNIALLSPSSVVWSALWCPPWWWCKSEEHLRCRHLSLRPRWRHLWPAEPPSPESEEHAAHPPCSWNQSVEGQRHEFTLSAVKKLGWSTEMSAYLMT